MSKYYSPTLQKIGERIANARKRQNMSQEELACKVAKILEEKYKYEQKVSISKQTISNIETGRCETRLIRFSAIMDALEDNADYILRGVDPMEKDVLAEQVKRLKDELSALEKLLSLS